MAVISTANANLSPPVSTVFLSITAIIFFVGLVSLGSWWSIAAVIPMIIINHSGHEAVHGCLAIRRNRRLNSAFGWVAYALVGQNFILMRWSHLAHHRYGRRCPDETIDACPAAANKFYYYAALFGASNIYHELAGYLYPIVGTSRFHILDRNFYPRYYLTSTYLLGQVSVLVINCYLWWSGGFAFLLIKILFTLYWGANQNVAHYALPVGRYSGSRFASRTYRVPRWLNFISFGSGFYHLEHHLFPWIPGSRLEAQEVQDAVENKLGFRICVLGDIQSYIRDWFRQYKGPLLDTNRADALDWIPSTREFVEYPSDRPTNLYKC